MKLALSWPRDTDGYHIETVPAGHGLHVFESLPRQSPFDGDPYYRMPKRDEPYDVVVRSGGRLCSRPVVAPALYAKLAACTANAKGALKFSHQYGLLSPDPDKMEVSGFCGELRFVRRLLAIAKQGNWSKISELLEVPFAGDPSKRTKMIMFSGIIGFDEAGQPQLEFEPIWLTRFIYAQLIQDYTTGAQYKLCKRPGCGEYFYFGPGTGKRNTAEYCSTKCQGAHAYRKRKGESK